MNYEQRVKWEQFRVKSKWRFILPFAFLLCAASVVATSIFDHFFSYNGFRPQDLYIKVPIHLVSGLVGGLVIWYFREYQYQKSSSSTIDAGNGELTENRE